MIKNLFIITGFILLIQLAVRGNAMLTDSDADPIYRFLTDRQQPCIGDECLFQSYKRSPNGELVLNRDNLVTLLRHMYPKTSFTSPFLGKRAIQLKKRGILAPSAERVI